MSNPKLSIASGGVGCGVWIRFCDVGKVYCRDGEETVRTLLLLLSFRGFYSWGQSKDAASPAAAVSMSIEPFQNPMRLGEKVWVKATITNNTDEFLILSYISTLSSFYIQIRDAQGNVPKEN